MNNKSQEVLSTIAMRPKVGVGVLIVQDGKILLGKRKNAHGSGRWAPPGGHLEFGESFEECAKREMLEETALKASNISFYAITNDIFVDEGKHYITIFMLVDSFSGEPRLLEPDKCEAWQWFFLDALPDALFIPLKNLIAQQNTFISLDFSCKVLEGA